MKAWCFAARGGMTPPEKAWDPFREVKYPERLRESPTRVRSSTARGRLLLHALELYDYFVRNASWPEFPVCTAVVCPPFPRRLVQVRLPNLTDLGSLSVEMTETPPTDSSVELISGSLSHRTVHDTRHELRCTGGQLRADRAWKETSCLRAEPGALKF